MCGSKKDKGKTKKLKGSRPFKCPVCGGRGKVGCNFYTNGGCGTSSCDETCRSCGGTGIVWSTPEAPNPFGSGQ